MFADRRFSRTSILLRPEKEESDEPLKFTFNPMADIRTSLAGFGQQETLKNDPSLLSACLDGDEFRLRDIMVRKRLNHQSVNMTDPTGKTALSHVCAQATVNLGILDLLLLIPGVDPNIGDNEGNYPLHFAAQAGHADVVSRLLTAFPHIKVDVRNYHGLTPLMKAALQGKTRCAKLLLAAGASPALKDTGRGLTALEWANFCGREGAAKTIESFSKIQQRRSSAWNVDEDLSRSLDDTSLHYYHGRHRNSFATTSSDPRQPFAHKIRRVFRSDPKRDEFDLARNLVLSTTSAALFPGSSAQIGLSEKSHPVPKLQISLSPTSDPTPSTRRMSFKEFKRLDYR